MDCQAIRIIGEPDNPDKEIDIYSAQTQIEESSESPIASEPKTPEPLTDQIALPQFAWINLAADTTQQKQTFENPSQNFAQFQVSLVLDGETLWESELLKPGETSAPVVLTRPLEAGDIFH